MSISPFLKALIISTFLHAQLAPATAEVTLPGQPTSNLNSGLMQSPPQNQDLSSDAQEYLNVHNNIRSRKGVPSLQWDANLAKYAQDWANNGINECKPHHHSGGPYGENILWEQYDEKTPTQVMQVWMNEEANYDHVKMACKCEPDNPKCMCGHYTQIVWSATKAVGCGNITCNNELGVLIVCSYNPPGNYRNQNPFQKADLPPRYPAGARKPRRKRHHKPHGPSKVYF